jgi:programmed cell death 6-interacting protein
MDILDSEASEDEAARSSKPLKRQPSHVANQDLTSKAERYRRILTEAQDSDEHVRQKWDECETNIRSLTWDEVSFSFLADVSFSLIYALGGP